MSQDQTQPVTETKDAATEATDNAKERAAGDKVAALSDTDGVVGDVAEKVSEGLTHASEWVAGRDPESMLTEAKSFAKRKPWVTAGIAVGALLVLNRITRALTGGGRR